MYILYEVDMPADEWLNGIDKEVCGSGVYADLFLTYWPT